MSFAKKSDVKMHLSMHDRNGRSRFGSSSQPDATGIANEASRHAETHATEGSSQQAVSLEHPDGSAPIQAAAASKSASD
jgi:hypothetical protein